MWVKLHKERENYARKGWFNLGYALLPMTFLYNCPANQQNSVKIDCRAKFKILLDFSENICYNVLYGFIGGSVSNEQLNHVFNARRCQDGCKM